MIGKFILIPLLLAYAAILLVYAVQIVITRQLPEGMLGWMVLGFVTAGAGAWLVLHPEFLRDSIIVRFFRRWWFWLTIVPLILYFVAVQVRHRRLRLHARAAAARLGRRLGDVAHRALPLPPRRHPADPRPSPPSASSSRPSARGTSSACRATQQSRDLRQPAAR